MLPQSNETSFTVVVEMAEKQQVAALRNDDVKAFDKLFREYGKRLYFFAYGYLKSKEEAEEVVQEVFFRIWRNRKSLKTELSFKAYLFKIAYHHILEVFEKAEKRNSYLHELADTSEIVSSETEDQINYSALLERIEELVEQLPQRQKEIFRKRKIEGLPVKAIAEELNISPKTIENHLTQAMKRIKLGLDESDLSLMLFLLLFVND